MEGREVARTKLPDPLARRHLLERELGAAQALKIAEAYLGEGRSVEAVDFLREAGAAERLAELARAAVADGDAFLLRAVARARGGAPSREEWRSLAEAARNAGKEHYADDATRQLERAEE